MGARSTNLLAVAASFVLAGAAGCDETVARPIEIPRGAAKVVVVETDGTMCAAADDEPEQWLPEQRCVVHRPVEYVKMSEWTPPPSVQDLEAAIPPRGDAPPSYIEFPAVTKHASIDGSSMHFRRR